MVVGILFHCRELTCSHLSTGQEAVAVGIEHAITREDNVDPFG
jgi:TPP-dependent pyruvate/acetoin dehydrogenase alpha subunit